MDAAFATIVATLRGFAPYAAAFMLLALVVKRTKIVAAIRTCRREATTNFLLYLVNGLIIAPLFVVPVVALQSFVGDYGLLSDDQWAMVPELLTLALAIVLIDFVAYWRHRIEHEPALWRFHATHHADTAIHWLSVHRKHPVGKVFSMLFDSLIVIALGVPVWAIVGAGLIRTIWGFFIHSDVPWTLGLFGEVLISPAAHRLHHIRDEALMGSNYGNTVTLWDKLFGTWRDPAPYLDCETGIEEGTRGFLGELARPFEARYRRKPPAQGNVPIT